MGARAETVTVVYTDVVGSTAWRAMVGEDVADVRTAEFDRACRHVVDASGGAVVKGLGDGLMATFSSAVDALDVAVGLQAVAQRLALSGVESCLRVGISSGDMVREGEDWLGAAAIEASRLCADAVGGSVLVADATARLSRGRGSHKLRSVGMRVLRGFDAAIEVFELISDRSAEQVLPVGLARSAEVPLVGRRSELDRAASVLEAVSAGATATLLIGGEPGVGKSRLAAAMAVAAAQRGFSVLYGRCNEGLAAPFQPVVDAIAPWLAQWPDSALERIVGPRGRELLVLLPELAERLSVTPITPVSDPETRRSQLFEAVAGMLEVIASERPLMLVIDDLQWAEPSTRLLLGHLARNEVPGLVQVATARMGDVGVAEDLVGDPGSGHTWQTWRLDGLDREDVAELVARHAGAEPPAELSTQLCQRTGGNPLFLAALLKHLDDVAFVRDVEGHWLTRSDLETSGVPEGVRAVIGRRLGSLDPGTRRVLEVAAVRGLVFDEHTVRGVLDAPVDETVDALDRASAAGIVREDAAGSFAFAHALMRQCVLDGLSRTGVARLHWRIAEQLERDVGAHRRVQEIAHHYASGADVGEDATIVRTSLAAGDEAYARLAFEEAATHLRRALTRLDGVEAGANLRYRILASLGHALNALSDAESSRPIWLDAIALARAQEDPEGLFGALMGYRYVSHLTLDIDLAPLIDEVLRLLEPADSPVRALALALRAVPILRNDLARSPVADRAMADQAVAMARRTGDPVARVSTLRARLALRAEYPDLDVTRRDAEELGGLLPAVDGISRDSSAVLRELTRAMVRVGRRPEAENYLMLAEQAAASNRLPLATPLNLLLKSALAVARGELDEGMHLSNEVARYAGPNQALCQLLHAAQRLAIHMERGKLDTVIRTTTHVDVPFTAQRWAAVRAGALADAGRHDEASAELRFLVDSSAQTTGYATSLVIRYLPEVCRQLGDETCAGALLADVVNWSKQILVVATGVSIEGAADRSVGHLLATLGRLDEADVAYRAAASLERSAGFPALLARTEYWHARALLERDAHDDRERAKQLLDHAIELTTQHGQTLLRRQASELSATLLTAPA